MVDRPPNVRIATADDEDKLYDLLMSLWKHNPLRLPYDPSTVLETIRCGTRPVNGQPMAIIGVIDGNGSGGALLGSLGLFFGPAAWFVNDIWWLFERWLFVEPFARGSTQLYKDLFAFATWARDDMRHRLGPDYPHRLEVVASWTSSDRQEAKDRLWSRFGVKTGSSFILK